MSDHITDAIRPLVEQAQTMLEEAAPLARPEEIEEARATLAYLLRAASERAPLLLEYPELWEDYIQGLRTVAADLAADIEAAILRGERRAQWDWLKRVVLSAANRLLEQALSQLDALIVRLVQQALAGK